KDFIQTIVDDAKQILVATNTKEYKSIKLIEIAKEKVDIRGIGNYSIGKYRKQLNKNQKDEYNALFEKYFLKSFTSRLSDYSDPKIKVISSEVINKNYTIVSSILEATTQKPEVKINWRVYTKDPENLKIRDLIIEGISLARTQKEEFSSIIDSNSGNINSLFSKLEEFINN
ncbi:MAG: ABC transporter substrate-binding protein, partial [Candidatus Pelagibacterales bacterium]